MEQKNSLIWAVIGVIVIIAAALGYYFYADEYNTYREQRVEETGDVSDMAAEIEGVNLEGLDSELADIDAELK